MTYLTVTLSQGQISMSKCFSVWVLLISHNLFGPHTSDSISPTDFVLDTNVQPNKALSMTQVMVTLIGKGSKSSTYKITAFMTHLGVALLWIFSVARICDRKAESGICCSTYISGRWCWNIWRCWYSTPCWRLCLNRRKL